MLILTGTVTKGLGAATQTFKKQRPYFNFPNRAALYNGSINVDISPKQFTIERFDYFFPDIEWEPNRKETFGFITIDKIVHAGSTYANPGYIYVPHNSPHFIDHSMLEIVSMAIPGIKVGDVVKISIPDGRLKI